LPDDGFVKGAETCSFKKCEIYSCDRLSTSPLPPLLLCTS